MKAEAGQAMTCHMPWFRKEAIVVSGLSVRAIGGGGCIVWMLPDRQSVQCMEVMDTIYSDACFLEWPVGIHGQGGVCCTEKNRTLGTHECIWAMMPVYD